MALVDFIDATIEQLAELGDTTPHFIGPEYLSAHDQPPRYVWIPADKDKIGAVESGGGNPRALHGFPSRQPIKKRCEARHFYFPLQTSINPSVAVSSDASTPPVYQIVSSARSTALRLAEFRLTSSSVGLTTCLVSTCARPDCAKALNACLTLRSSSE